MYLRTINSPRPLDIQEALNICLANQVHQPFNLSMSGNELPSQQAHKINGMKRKMLISELKMMVGELIQMLRFHNMGIKSEILKYEAEMIVYSQSISTAFSATEESIEMEKKLAKRMLSDNTNDFLTPNGKRATNSYLSGCQCYKKQQGQFQKQLQKLKLESEKYQTIISGLKKQNYKIHEENFTLQQKVKELQGQVQIISQKLIRQNTNFSKQKEQFQDALRRLQQQVKQKENKIELLENAVKKNKKSCSSKDEDEQGSSNGNRNISQDELVSFENPLDKGFRSEHTSRYYRTFTHTQIKQSDILPKTAQKKKDLQVKFEPNILSPHRKPEELRSQFEALSPNKSRNRKSLSKDKINLEKIGMQLQNLTNELEMDLKRINYKIR